jgi:hypothetical protein
LKFVKLIPLKPKLCNAYYCCCNFGKDMIQIGRVSGKGKSRKERGWGGPVNRGEEPDPI